MSRENVEAVQAALNAMASGGLDALAEHWTDDIDHRAIEGSIDDRGPIHGKEAMRAYVPGSTAAANPGSALLLSRESGSDCSHGDAAAPAHGMS